MPFIFNNNCIKAFKEIKDYFFFPILYYYNLDLELMLKIDIFNKVIAGILSQLHLDSEWYPVAFFLKTIDLVKYNYKIHNKEMLAII